MTGGVERGKLLVTEGIDGSGKSLQTDLLVGKLRSIGLTVYVDDYPRYETSFWGRHVGRMLKGDFGDPMKIDPSLTCLPYLLDEADGSRANEARLQNGVWVVSNRYFTSNIHQIAKLPVAEREEYARWLWQAGYGELGILRPDLVTVLLVDPLVCRENIGKKAERKYTGGEVLDYAEKDFGHQMVAAEEYRRMVDKNPDWWVAIECCVEGKLLTPEQIHEMVWGEIEARNILKG
ncbi:MAG: hypothetical protein WCV93_01790 [Candidatus Shapirobacteria bacterium]|jgi:dTMP kinase